MSARYLVHIAAAPPAVREIPPAIPQTGDVQLCARCGSVLVGLGGLAPNVGKTLWFKEGALIGIAMPPHGARYEIGDVRDLDPDEEWCAS